MPKLLAYTKPKTLFQESQARPYQTFGYGVLILALPCMIFPPLLLFVFPAFGFILLDLCKRLFKNRSAISQAVSAPLKAHHQSTLKSLDFEGLGELIEAVKGLRSQITDKRLSLSLYETDKRLNSLQRNFRELERQAESKMILLQNRRLSLEEGLLIIQEDTLSIEAEIKVLFQQAQPQAK